MHKMRSDIWRDKHLTDLFIFNKFWCKSLLGFLILIPVEFKEGGSGEILPAADSIAAP